MRQGRISALLRAGSLTAGLWWRLAVASILTVAFATTTTEPANAQWTPPTGTEGWCAVAGGNRVCFGDPQSACRAHLDWRPNELYPYSDTKYWWSKQCHWERILGTSLPSAISFHCASGYVRIAPGICVNGNENFPSVECFSCDPNNGGSKLPSTPFPINILDGAKAFRGVDFVTADGGLTFERRFSTRPAGASFDTFITLPLGLTNWRFNYGLELHLGDDWDDTGEAGLATPAGGHFRFKKSGSVMVPATSVTYPIKSTDYSLEFVGTWPSSFAALTKSKSSWIVRDRGNRTWHLETMYNARTTRFDIARPVRLVEPGGLELAFTYSSGALYSITDSYGRALNFEWLRGDVEPIAINRVSLPDGTTLDFGYEATSTVAGAVPDRLTSVERRQGATVLEKTTYDYGDARFPFWVTGVRDKDGALRWSAAYDAEGRATASEGPGGVDAYSVAYGTPGPTFTRTVTNPLGKSTVFTFSRTSTTYNLKLTSAVDQASTNSPARTTSYTYNANNYLASETDPENRVTAYTRDTNGRNTQVVEGLGSGVARTSGATWHSTWNEQTQNVTPGLTTDVTLTSGSSGAAPPDPNYVASQTFGYTGAAATYTVPGGVTSATIRLWGGAGGASFATSSAWSGAGGYVEATFPVTPGDTLTFEVAGGGEGAIATGPGGAGGWPDGGGGSQTTTPTGGGGGSTRFYINSVLKAVAGGGGGSSAQSNYGPAGAGGGLVGQSADTDGGTGGSQSAGGVDSDAPTSANKTGRSILAFPGVQRTGGWGNSLGTNNTTTGDAGGGGGGGYWGGGGGGGNGAVRQSGGGGSSWIDPSASAVQNHRGHWPTPFSTPPGQPTVATGVFSGTTTAAVKGGDGYAFVGVK